MLKLVAEAIDLISLHPTHSIGQQNHHYDKQQFI
jgi:hypothetical protein